MEYVYTTSRSGLTVRIPKDRYAEWKQAQEKMPPEEVKKNKAALARLKSKLAKK